MTDDLKTKLKECEKKRDEYLAGWQRAKADFINHKKEEMERMEEILKYSLAEFILKILPVLDNFNLAEEKLSEEEKGKEEVKGLLQIKQQLVDFLKGYGVSEILCVGKEFDPNFHEAVEMVEDGDCESGIVLEEIQKGYLLNDKLLRPAKVKVAK